MNKEGDIMIDVKKVEIIDMDINDVIIEDWIKRDDTAYKNLNELQESIKTVGVINPPIVDENYRLLSGTRVFEAYKQLGGKKIKVMVIKDLNEIEKAILPLIDEVLKKDHSPIERAKIIYNAYVSAGIHLPPKRLANILSNSLNSKYLNKIMSSDMDDYKEIKYI